ncbi:MAG: GNAT family N-acetyltransferase [Deltaproteobacteria bacterium]|nr:GNAT family N-acetyltransferase [Deltaproteobacteria bacterium]
MQSLGWDLVRADVDLIERVWKERWGLPLCSVGRTFMPRDVEGRALVMGDRMLGLITWVVNGSDAEIVTLDSFVEERGVGTRLLTAAEEAIRTAGGKRVATYATNDNLHALGFHLRRGYRLVKVHQGIVAELRKIKPVIPEAGRSGIPIVDLWEIAKPLA